MGNIPSATTTQTASCKCQRCLLLQAMGDNQQNDGVPCIAQQQWNNIISALTNNNTTTISNSTLPTVLRPSIPIRVRLAVERSSKEANKPKSNNKLETFLPPPDPTVGSNDNMTIADYTKYLVEELFINNREKQFDNRNNDKHKAKFFTALLLNSKISKKNECTFSYYGMNKVKKSISVNNKGRTVVLNEEQIDDDIISSDVPSCIVNFSLRVETGRGESNLTELDGSCSAYDVLYSQSCSANNNQCRRLDLVLNAYVMTLEYSPQQPSQQELSNSTSAQLPTSITTTATKAAQKNKPTNRKRVYDEVEFSDRSTTSSLGGSPQRRSLKQRKTVEAVSANEALADDGNGSGRLPNKYKNGIPQCLAQAWDNQAAPSSSMDVKACGKKNSPDKYNNSSKRLEEGASEKMAASSAADVEMKEVSESCNESSSTKEVIDLTKNQSEGKGGDDLDNKSLSSTSNRSSSYVDKAENVNGVVAVADRSHNVESARISSSATKSTNNSDDECTTNKERNNTDKKGSSSSSSDSSDSEDDDDRPQLTDKKSDVAVAFDAVASAKATPYACEQTHSDAAYTQQSAMNPTVLFDDGNKVNQHMRGEEIKSSTTPFDKKKGDTDTGDDSDSSSSSSSNNSSIDLLASSQENSQEKIADDDNNPLPQESRDSGNPTDDSVKQNDDDKKKVKADFAGPTPEIPMSKINGSESDNEESSGSSSGSSSSSSSSSSSDDTDDSDSDSDSSSSDEEEGKKEVGTTTGTSDGGSVIPIARSSVRGRGRRRTPLVLASRKIVIDSEK